MKKYLVYLGLIAAGLLLGWLLFGGSSQPEANHNHDETATVNQMWTCSMHPSVMQPEPGDCPICGMDLIPAEAGADGLAADQFKMTENAMALANIQTTVIGEGSVADQALKLSGKIAENEEANAVQVSYFSGRIERLNVSFTGEEVRQGQLLASVYSPELYAAQQELLTAASLKASQPTLYNAVRNKLKLWKLTDKQISQIEETGKIIENFLVYATVSGTVTQKLVEQGDYIKQGQPLLKIANLNSVWANFDLYEHQIELIKKGKEVTVTTNAYPNQEFKGKVDFIDPILNTKTRTVKLRVVLNNKDNLFKPGMFVTAKVDGLTTTSDQVLTLPASSVLWTGERSVVYVKTNPDAPVFEMKEVVLGKQIGDSYQVKEGLDAGVEVVTNGTFTVDAAAQLQGKKSMMNKQGGKVMTGHEAHLGMESDASPSFKLEANQRLEVSKAFQQQLKTVYESYILLKDALVQDSSDKVTTEAVNLLNQLNKVDMKLVKGAAHDDWMTLSNGIKRSATALSKNKEIKAQRNHFKPLSEQLIVAVQKFGVDQKVFVEFCPMADNDKGAYWLSKEEQIRNPYFGDAMLKCGSVKQVIE